MIQATELPLFDRVSQINYRVADPTQIKLAREDVVRMRELRQITVAKKRARTLSDTEVHAVTDIVPPCRLASVEKRPKAQIAVNMKPGSPYSCNSN